VKASREYKRFKTSETKLHETQKLFAHKRKRLLLDPELRRLRSRMTTLRRQCIRNEVQMMQAHGPVQRDDWHELVEPTYRKYRDMSGFFYGGVDLVYGSDGDD